MSAQKHAVVLKTQESASPSFRRVVKTIPKKIDIKKGAFTVTCKGKLVNKRSAAGIQTKQHIYSSKMPVISTRNQTVKMRHLDMSKSC